jgi:hypothetical protein
MTTYYKLNKDKILNYKKEFYKTQHQCHHAFKNIKIRGFAKRQSTNLIKSALSSNHLIIVLNETTYFTVSEFIKKYKFKPYSVIEVDGFDTTLASMGNCEDIPYYDLIQYYDDNSNHDLELNVWDNMLLKID